MGLFDNFKKIALDKVVDTVEKTVGVTTEAISDVIGNNSSNNSSNNSPPPSVAPQTNDWASIEGDPLSVEQKFDEIFATEFQDLQIIKEASPDSVGISAPTPCRPYSYALLRNGQVVVLILLTQHNRDHNAAFLNAKASAENSPIAFLNFYTHYPNERNYVINRIRSVL